MSAQGVGNGPFDEHPGEIEVEELSDKPGDDSDQELSDIEDQPAASSLFDWLFVSFEPESD